MSTSYTTSELKSKLELRSSLYLPTEFHFWNGDEYTGEFALLKEKQKFIREGEGVYKTSDGQVYEGTWSDDTLVNNCKITYPDRSIFRGFLEDMVMDGQGQYTFKEGVTVEANFSNNYPMGRVILKDPNGHMWGGVLKEGDTSLYFQLFHPFWMSLLDQSALHDSLFYGETDEEGVTTWENDKLNYTNNKFN